MLNSWITAFGSATAAGLDPARRTSPFYVTYDTSKSAWVGAVPHNIMIDAKTRKVLATKISYTKLEAEFQKYAQ